MSAANDAPVYRRIADAIAERIVSGDLTIGARLPSERQIAEEAGASRMTARQAMKLLDRRGLIETRPGLGAFVAKPRIEQELRTLTGFTEEMSRGGRLATSLVLDVGPASADAEAAQALGLGEGAPLYRLIRVRLADGEPVAIERTEIPRDLAPGLPDCADFSTASLYCVLRQTYGLLPSSAEQTLCAGQAEGMAAEALKLPVGAAVLKLTRQTRDPEGRVLEFVRSTYRGDCFVMRVRLSLEDGA